MPSIVSPDLTITGNLESSGDIQVDGRVDGDVEAANLTIGETGVVQGTVKASVVHVCGAINGEVHAASVTLASTARIQGDIVHESLAIEAGAYLDGHCRRQDASQQRAASSGNKRKAAMATAGRGEAAEGAADGPDGANVTNMAGSGTGTLTTSSSGSGGTKRGQ